MSFPLITLKGDGTLETGEKIITRLRSLGASNSHNYTGFVNAYYYINCIGDITNTIYFPVGYKLVTLEQKQKLFKLI